jgi:hypothetical protein
MFLLVLVAAAAASMPFVGRALIMEAHIDTTETRSSAQSAQEQDQSHPDRHHFGFKLVRPFGECEYLNVIVKPKSQFVACNTPKGGRRWLFLTKRKLVL